MGRKKSLRSVRKTVRKIVGGDLKTVCKEQPLTTPPLAQGDKKVQSLISLPLEEGDLLYHGSTQLFNYPYFPSNKDNRFTYARNIAVFYAKKTRLSSNVGYVYTYKKKSNGDTEIPNMLLYCDQKTFVSDIEEKLQTLKDSNQCTAPNSVPQIRKNNSGDIDITVSAICDCSVNGIYFPNQYESQILLCDKVASKYFDIVSITKIERVKKGKEKEYFLESDVSFQSSKSPILNDKTTTKRLNSSSSSPTRKQTRKSQSPSKKMDK